MKFLEFHLRMQRTMKIKKSHCDNFENHENHRIAYENHGNYENLRIVMRIKKIITILALGLNTTCVEASRRSTPVVGRCNGACIVVY